MHQYQYGHSLSEIFRKVLTRPTEGLINCKSKIVKVRGKYLTATLFRKLNSGAHDTRLESLANGVYRRRQIPEDVSPTSSPISEVRLACQLLGLFRLPLVQKQVGPEYPATYRREFIAVQFCHAISQNVTHEKSRICASGLSVDACVVCDRFPLPIRLYPPIRAVARFPDAR